MNLHFMPKPRQMIGGRKPTWTGPDHQHAFAGSWRFDRQLPARFCSEIAQKPLYSMNTDGAVELLAIAVFFTGMVANAPVNGWQGVVRN